MAEINHIEVNPIGTRLPVAEKGRGRVEKLPADTVSTRLGNERPLALPHTRLQSATKKKRIDNIKNALGGIHPEEPDRKPAITPELLRYSEGGRDMIHPAKEIATRITIAKEELLPQDKKRRVVTVGRLQTRASRT